MVDEVRELENNPSFYTNSGGDSSKKIKNPKKLGPAALLGIFGLIFIIFIFLGGNYIPDTINTVLTEETDMQCANGTIDKEWVFIETLRNGQVPSDTAENLKTAGAIIVDENGNESKTGTALKYKDKILSGEELFNELQTNVSLYTAFNDATYSCAAFYYDEAAQKTFKELGTTRNNYTEDSDLTETLEKAVGSGSDISINTVYKEKIKDEETKEEKYIYQKSSKSDTKTSSLEAEKIVDSIRQENPANTATESALNTADILKVADTASKEQRSSSFFLYFMENISKMKAGAGNDSKINDAMNFLTDSRESQIVDIETGEIITTKGTPLESPSLYAILSGSQVSIDETKNYSSDRILKTIENQTGSKESSSNSILTTISSIGKNIKGSITRFITNTIETVELSVLSPIIPTIASSLINNSFENSIYGISGGEFLVEGAVNVGKKLAIMGSGASAGDEAAVLAYNKQVQYIANLNNQSDALNRNPLDPTSKNTFLGSFIYKLLPVASKTSSFINVVSKSLASIIPGAHADSDTKYLSTFGNNETLSTISAVGTVHGSVIATFDTTTQHDPYNNKEFQAFINENTKKDTNGNTVIKDDSILARYIIYNNERTSPIGTNDAGILSSLQSGLKKIMLSTNLTNMVEIFENASDEEKRIASGAAFVNSTKNPDWEQYKYAQRYVSINRALSALKQYSTDETAYNNLKGFEGTTDSVIAFTEKYYKEHPKDDSYEGQLASLTGLPKETIISVLEELNNQEFIANYNPSSRYFFEPLNTSNDHLVISEVSNQAFTPTLVEFGKYIIKKNDWVQA